MTASDASDVASMATERATLNARRGKATGMNLRRNLGSLIKELKVAKELKVPGLLLLALICTARTSASEFWSRGRRRSTGTRFSMRGVVIPGSRGLFRGGARSGLASLRSCACCKKSHDFGVWQLTSLQREVEGNSGSSETSSYDSVMS